MSMGSTFKTKGQYPLFPEILELLLVFQWSLFGLCSQMISDVMIEHHIQKCFVYGRYDTFITCFINLYGEVSYVISASARATSLHSSNHTSLLLKTRTHSEVASSFGWKFQQITD